MRAMFTNRRDKTSGFTLVEVIVAITVLSILGVTVLNTLGNYFSDNVVSISKITQDSDARSVLYSIGKELTDSSGFLSSLPVVPPLAYYNNGTSLVDQSSGWSYLGLNGSDTPNNRVLIATKYATDTDPSNPSRQPLFIRNNGTCEPSDPHVVPAQVTFIYYMAKDPNDSNTYDLYRRTVVPPLTMVYCRGGTLYVDLNGNPGLPWQKQTCPLGLPVSLDLNHLCQGGDAILLRGITSFNVDYFTAPNDTVSHVAPIPGDQSVQLTVGINHMNQGIQVSSSATLRISR